jgi:hypothetical protein
MPKCVACGGQMQNLPAWLDDVNVVFRCGKCPETAPQGIGPASPAEADVEKEPLDGPPDGEEVDVTLVQEIDAEFEEETEETEEA